MRFCLFTPLFLPAIGGTEFVTDALARQFHAKGHEVIVLAQGRPAPLDVPYAVRWFPRPIAPRIFPERVGRHLARLHAERPLEVVAANYGSPCGYAAVKFGRAADVPVVVISHGGDLYRGSGMRRRPHVWKRVERAYREADALVAISPYIETLIREINPRPRILERIPNGVDVAAINRPVQRPADFTERRPFMLCLGNLGRYKGFAEAIAAYAAAREHLGELALVIVGAGKDDAALRRQAAELGLGQHVTFAGSRTGDEKAWFLQNCRFGVMPSLEEGHPLVALEFLAVGKPLICTTISAFDGACDDGVNGARVPPQSPDALAAAMVRVAQGDLESMGRESRRRAARYDWPTLADRYLALFERLISERTTPSPF